jgi:predicted esterase
MMGYEMKNLLVYLHGFNSYNHENTEFQKRLANKLDSHLLSPQAEMSSGRDRGGFAWYPFSIDCKNDLKSVWFVGHQALIYKDIDAKLKALKLDWDSVILSGRGQGAFIALKAALGGVIPNPKVIISFNGYYIDEGPF